MALGGKLRQELSDDGKNQNFMRIYNQLGLNGRVKDIPDSIVDSEMETLEAQQICRSNDAHILALARVSGARLLYTNDQALQRDFNNPQIVSDPRGQVYTTLLIGNRPYAAQRGESKVTNTHRELPECPGLCARNARRRP